MANQSNLRTSLSDKLTPDSDTFFDDELVRSRSGELIDTRNNSWRLGAEGVVNWDRFTVLHPFLQDAIREYIRHLIRNNSLIYAFNQHRILRVLTAEPLAKYIAEEIIREGAVRRTIFERFKEVVRQSVSEDNVGNYSGGFVRWYLWATDAGFSLFDPDTASDFENLRITGNPKGQAVLSHDEDRGPLREVEMTQLRSALKLAEHNGTLDLEDLALCWLMIAFGTNPRNLILLEEKDYICTKLEGGQEVHELRIPRIKKRTAGEREQFRTRRMVPEIGNLVRGLIERNQSRPHIKGTIRPIFRSVQRRSSLVGTPFEHKAYRRTSQSINIQLRKLGEKLGLTDARGEPLVLYPRRLRYSFATRLVQEGASAQEVADALDHTSTEHVMVYFNARSDAVKHLDRALSTILAPIAQAFLGTIIGSEAEATRTGDTSSRISFLNSETKKRQGLGNCGEIGLCGLFAPIACYTCRHFQAWQDGPHEQVFAALMERRQEKLEQGADPKWTQLYDETILAVSLVIQRCAAITGEDASA